ncbi:hypothetical protein [Methylotenera sp.]|uniref:hypothetical protein n=1 Tax=Methylotenera sp. TaxID=2051956 RepID=UPI002731E4DE|nr:hypothetical protein [Methylotenera sp.]MDP2230194.1 hypothetical protein [Methylotenera sp.]MDP3140104.1 hypothetical protein [Methylotenera sp.]
MSANKMFRRISQLVVLVGLFSTVTAVSADDVLGYLTDKDGRYTGPTVEDNVAAMDTDKNGFADVWLCRCI